jgi:hypothetical protein
VIAAIIRWIPADYRAAVHTEMQKRSRLLTLCEMEDCVERYQRSAHPSHSAGMSKSSNNEDAEITLSAAAAAPKGACWTCGKVGHKNQDCPSRKEGANGGKGNNGKTGRKKCGSCGKICHGEANCWLDPKNTNRRPAWPKEKKASANQEVSNVGASAFEVLCRSVCDDLADVGKSSSSDRRCQG